MSAERGEVEQRNHRWRDDTGQRQCNEGTKCAEEEAGRTKTCACIRSLEGSWRELAKQDIAHVSLLGTLPIFYTHGVSTAAWRDVSAAWLPFDEAGVWGGTVGAMVGGWFGAIPIALDWDREWQKWPCTVLWGAVLGWGVGRVLTNVLRLGVGRRIDLNVTETLPPSEAEREKIEQKKDD
ncbi:Glycosylphosphatidylinositol (GPI) anchor assembly protein [Exophiala xenobiotica]|uniref:Glycosylphosphatidylinositol (GPI) anchor assembly protein n=1 Tax=Lithohypha guttulata TaxID=1690604 RepID=A0ABR0K9A6_9EURO|nr:Glycosylphosphatidylinositol (GPI) anchor assembly protein [Lithohypha guttulata]KAK5316862.1 Glycosylphosphatidylinositol (GPI) anchor assembly protein [Exophiala xenobiotica]